MTHSHTKSLHGAECVSLTISLPHTLPHGADGRAALRAASASLYLAETAGGGRTARSPRQGTEPRTSRRRAEMLVEPWRAVCDPTAPAEFGHDSAHGWPRDKTDPGPSEVPLPTGWAEPRADPQLQGGRGCPACGAETPGHPTASQVGQPSPFAPGILTAVMNP